MTGFLLPSTGPATARASTLPHQQKHAAWRRAADAAGARPLQQPQRRWLVAAAAAATEGGGRASAAVKQDSQKRWVPCFDLCVDYIHKKLDVDFGHLCDWLMYLPF